MSVQVVAARAFKSSAGLGHDHDRSIKTARTCANAVGGSEKDVATSDLARSLTHYTLVAPIFLDPICLISCFKNSFVKIRPNGILPNK